MAKVLEHQLQHQSLQWMFRLISFRIDCFDLFVVQGTPKSLLQHRGLKASILCFYARSQSLLYRPLNTPCSECSFKASHIPPLPAAPECQPALLLVSHTSWNLTSTSRKPSQMGERSRDVAVWMWESRGHSSVSFALTLCKYLTGCAQVDPACLCRA